MLGPQDLAVECSDIYPRKGISGPLLFADSDYVNGAVVRFRKAGFLDLSGLQTKRGLGGLFHRDGRLALEITLHPIKITVLDLQIADALLSRYYYFCHHVFSPWLTLCLLHEL